MIACILIIAGVLIVIFSNKIVIPGLERLLGIETLVGKESVDYQPDGSYYYANPGAIMEMDCVGRAHRSFRLYIRHLALD